MNPTPSRQQGFRLRPDAAPIAFATSLLAAAGLPAPAVLHAAPVAGDHAPDRVLLAFAEGSGPADLNLPNGFQLESPAGRLPKLPDGTPVPSPTPFYVLHLPAGVTPAATVSYLSGHPALDYAETDGRGTGGGALVPNDPHFADQWHHARTAACEAWALTTGSPSVTLAVLDTGLNANLPDFAGRVVAGYDFVNIDSNPADDHGHGTAVAAVAAGTGNNAAHSTGVDWQCRIMPVKVLDSENNGFYSDWASGIDWAVANGAHVINLSAGGASSSITLTNAINNAIAAGAIFVTITHNDSSSSIRFPGRLDQSITVGATRNNDARSAFSNYGSAIDLVAPGGIGSGGGFSTNITTTSWTGQKSSFWGSSFAAPQVAGAACLVLARHPELGQASIETLLCASAEDGVGDASDTQGFDVFYGHGRLNIHYMLQLADRSQPAIEVEAGAGPAPTLRWTAAPPNAVTKRPFGVQFWDGSGPWVTLTGAVPLTDAGNNTLTWTDDGTETGSPPAARRFYRTFLRRD